MAKSYDFVNHPLHYTQGDIECIDAIEASLTKTQYQGFLKAQVMKYLWRMDYKGHGAQDVLKAEFYLKRLIHTYDEKKVTPLPVPSTT